MKAPRIHNRRGVALILTLAILAIVLILLMAFITSMRTERIAAKSYTDYVKAKLLADAAVDEAVALLRAGTPLQTNGPPPLYNQPTTFWTAPGLALTNYNGQFGTVELYSIRDTADVNPEAFANLNTNSLITGSNTVISATTNGIYANWINVGANGATPTANNPIVGRFAYWVDDEATKVNINSAWARDPTTGTQTNNSLLSEVTLDALQPPFNNPALSDAVKNERSPHPFNTPNEVRRSGNAALINADAYTSNQFYLTTYSVETNVDTWGRARIDLNALTQTDIDTPTSDVRVRMNETLYRTIYPFWNAGTASFEQKYSLANVRQILANIIDYRGSRFTDATQDGRDGLGIPQTYCGLKKNPYLNEIILHVMSTNSMNVFDVGGVITTNWDITVRAFVDVELINPFPEALGTNYQIVVEPDSANPITFELFSGVTNSTTLYPGNVTIGIDNQYPAFLAAIPGTQTIPSTPAITRILSNNVSALSLLCLSQTNTPPAGPVAANAQFVPVWQTTINNVAKQTANPDEVPAVTNVQIRMLKVLLRGGPADSSIRDWATITDFPQPIIIETPILWRQTPGNNVALAAWLRTQPAAAANSSGDKQAKGIAKNDPRMRTYVSVPPPGTSVVWAPTFGTGNSGATPHSDNSGNIFEYKSQLFVPTLIPDGAERDESPVQRTVSKSTFYIKEAAFESPGELGFIYSGNPWRTLRMQSSVATVNNVIAGTAGSPLNTLAEVNSIPDWVLLDIFTAAANPEMTGRININSTIFGSNDFPRPTALVPSVLHPRNPSLAALFFGIDTVPLSYGISNTTPTFYAETNWIGRYVLPSSFTPSLSQPQLSSMDVTYHTNAMFVAWSHDTNVPQTVHANYFVTNAVSIPTYYYDTNTLFLTPGEICEVAGIDNALISWPPAGIGVPNGPRKADKELIPRKIANLITTRSNAFTIWTTAQAIKDINTNGVYEANIDLVTGEVKVQAVVERYVDTTTIPPTVKFRTKYYRYIYE